VNIFIAVPEGVRARDLDCVVDTQNLRVGIKGNPPFINVRIEKYEKLFAHTKQEALYGRVKKSDSFWMLGTRKLLCLLSSADGRELQISCRKLLKGEAWAAALARHASNPLALEEANKQLMLQRFQEEHPGFDFSGAEFSGQAPDPRSFLGGVSYNSN
jgi:hypothetical protein